MGLILVCLWRLCILQDTVLVFFCLGVPSARCLLLVVLCATVVKRESRKNMPKAFALPSMLRCISYLWRYNLVYLSYYLSFIFFQRGQGYQLRRRMKKAQSVSGAAHTHERRVGD